MRLIGDSMCAGGWLAPQVEATTVAVDALLKGIYLYGWPESRGQRGMIRDAIKALCPDALDCIDEFGEFGEREAWVRFGTSADMGDSADS